MEKYILPNDLKVIGVPVKTFPNGINEAFDSLVHRLPEGKARPYYGIAECTPEGMTYKAAALEKQEGEAEEFGLETYKVEKGEYLAVEVIDWRQKIASIKDVFENIYKDNRVDRSKPSIEIYQNEREMLCMVKLDSKKQILADFETTTKELFEVLAKFNNEEINKVPSNGGWSAAQVAEHIRKSDKGIVRLLTGDTTSTQRDPAEKIDEIKNTFLDFGVKMNSPEVLIPADKIYEKESIIRQLTVQREQIRQATANADLNETCIAFPFPGFGDLTRLEILHFNVYHTQRHIHQIERIGIGIR